MVEIHGMVRDPPPLNFLDFSGIRENCAKRRRAPGRQDVGESSNFNRLSNVLGFLHYELLETEFDIDSLSQFFG